MARRIVLLACAALLAAVGAAQAAGSAGRSDDTGVLLGAGLILLAVVWTGVISRGKGH